MKVLYFDAFAGLSGDMIVGALLAVGVPLEHLRTELAKLPVGGYTIDATPRQVHGIRATKFEVHVTAAAHTHRAFRDIRHMLEHSGLSDAAKQRAIAVFTALAEAEGRIHGVETDAVEFHEIGAVDSIVDIAAAAIGITWLGISSIFVSALPLGSGMVHSQHGPLPVPAPATVELLRGFLTQPACGEGELVTPTGAAIIATLARKEAVPELRVLQSGYGAGQRSLQDRPNLLRIIIGETVRAYASDTVMVIETNIDDYNPELYDYVLERLFAAGARDVYLTPVHMKKNRPGIVLSVICTDTDRERLAAIILSETSAIGVRYFSAQRIILARELREVQTPYGVVRVKVAVAPDGRENIAPEYDDCRQRAAEHSVPLKLVYETALAVARRSATRK